MPTVKPAPANDRILVVAAAIVCIIVVGVVAVADILADGKLDPGVLGLLSGIAGPTVVAAILLKTSGR